MEDHPLQRPKDGIEGIRIKVRQHIAAELPLSHTGRRVYYWALTKHPWEELRWPMEHQPATHPPACGLHCASKRFSLCLGHPGETALQTFVLHYRRNRPKRLVLYRVPWTVQTVHEACRWQREKRERQRVDSACKEILLFYMVPAHQLKSFAFCKLLGFRVPDIGKCKSDWHHDLNPASSDNESILHKHQQHDSPIKAETSLWKVDARRRRHDDKEHQLRNLGFRKCLFRHGLWRLQKLDLY